MQEAVDLNKRKIAFKLFHLCEPHAGGGAGPPRVCVDQHEPHVVCSCGDGIPLNGCDLLLSILVKLGVRALMNLLASTLAGPGLVENEWSQVSAKHFLASI